MRFVDEAKIKAKAGDGGPGIVAWRREKFVPMGGPSGGDGGKGGDIIIVAKEGMNSLLELKRQALLSAEDGSKGETKNKTGRQGRDKFVSVPVGTEIVLESAEGRRQFDLLQHNQRLVICRGGDGGFGNSHFKSQRCNAPERATPGFKGEERDLKLTLKLMADVGLLGFPNAGKSTLLTKLSNARPKIADYPFTTLRPMVGVCELDLQRCMVIADVPGLIEGASSGYGLGFRFLKHLERVRVLCHIIDGSDEADLKNRYDIINRELVNYSQKLSDLRQIVVINKMDVVSEDLREQIEEFVTYLSSQKIQTVMVSAITNLGINALKEVLYQAIVTENDGTENGHGYVSKFDPLKNLY
jgi:GTPase